MFLNSTKNIWTVCFTGDASKHWIQRFLKKGFYHTYAFTLSGGGQFFIVIDPTKSHTNVDIIVANNANFKMLTDNAIFINAILDIDINKDRGGFCRFNCVELVKSLLGIESFFTFTPHQLYKRLKSYG